MRQERCGPSSVKDDSHAIAGHYGRADLGAVILAALAATGKDVDRLTPDDLEPVDQLHSRGRTATIDLAGLLALDGHERILDLGCGIGGPSRYLAKNFGCRVTGLDLTPEFCRVATMLAQRTGLADKVDYRVGNALAMPFADASFDVIWSQNVAMNIAERDRLYAEIHRALGLHIVLGQDGPTMLKNMLRNFEEQRTGLVQGIVARQ